MITAEQLDILETARRFAQFDEAGWKGFLAERCAGIEDPQDLSPKLYDSLVDWFLAMGFRDPRIPMVSPDYMRLLGERRRKAGFTDEQWHLLLLGTGYQGPDQAINGICFLRVMMIFQALGYSPEQLSRASISRKQIGLIQTARRALDLDDQTYTHLLMELGGGVLTSRHLDRRGFHRVVCWLVLHGFEGPAKGSAGKPTFGQRPGMASPAQVALIRDLWQEVTGAADEAALAAWLERTCKVSNLRFLTGSAAAKAITGLKAMKGRQGAAAAGSPPASGQTH